MGPKRALLPGVTHIRAVTVSCFLIFTAVQSADAQDAIAEFPNCIKERISYESDGLLIVGYISRPRGDGPFPVIIYNHHSRIAFINGRAVDRTKNPTISMTLNCAQPVLKNRVLMFVPEGRGYGGSQGKSAFDDIITSRNSENYIVNRARDINAGVRWLLNKPYVAQNCMLLVGYSHGAVATLIAAPHLDASPVNYRAAIAAATGLSYGRDALTLGMQSMQQAISITPFPLHLWHAKNDLSVPPDVSRRLANFAMEQKRDVTHIEFDGVPNQDGHFFFGFEDGYKNYDAWGPAFESVLDSAFFDCRRN